VPDDRRVLEGATHLVVDGTNVLYALARAPAPLPAAALIGRLRAIVPPPVGITVVLDGSPEHGLVSRRIASGVEVRYSGRASADELIGQLMERTPPGQSAGIVVVTDDAELAATVRRAGGCTARTGWLIDRLGRQRLSAPAPGRPGPGRQVSAAASPAGSESGAGEDEEVPRWTPGRGATRKRGNPRRGHPGGRPGGHPGGRSGGR
jgi:hypothetical protein